MSKLKQIQAILANDDVRDPQATIAAIEKVLNATADGPVATIRIFDNPDSKGPLKATVTIDYSSSRIEPRHIKAVVLAIDDFVDERIAEQGCPGCEACESDNSDGEENLLASLINRTTNGRTQPVSLRKLFEEFEAEVLARNKGGAK